MEKGQNGVTRTAFVKGGLAAGAVAVASKVVPGCTPTVALAGEDPAKPRVTTELPLPESAAPEQLEYECDVLVIGGGYAGMNAAVAATEAGASVVVIDKGTPGYAGLSAWPGTHAWVDPEYDDVETLRESMHRGGDYMSNMNWLDIWLNESKEMKERLESWGILDHYDRASDADGGSYWENDNFVGYKQEVVADHDRHTRFMAVLRDHGVDVLTHTMITDVIVEDGKAKGAVGFHVPSGAAVVCHAKAVVMCMGQGSFKSQGWPTSADTFDGEYIAYNLGLPICNKETEDYHSTNNTNPGHTFMFNSWNWLENMWFCGVNTTYDADDLNAYGKNQQRLVRFNTNYRDGLLLVTSYSGHTKGKEFATPEENGGDERTGKATDGVWKDEESNSVRTGGASPGFCGHLMPGVFCGWDDTTGFTGIDGLYVAGDGMNACPPNGFGYGPIHGLTSSFCSLMGRHAGEAAGDYVRDVELQRMSDQAVEAAEERMFAPMNRERGFDATWCINTLNNVMTPYFAIYEKTDRLLEAALAYVETLRDQVVPKLLCGNTHDLRLCHEAAHKVLSAEMKLRAGLARKESRGFCFHSDYQFRNDDEFLCYLGCVKQEDGTMGIEKFPIPEEWQGDRTEDYATRFTYFFPGEGEALGRDDLDS